MDQLNPLDQLGQRVQPAYEGSCIDCENYRVGSMGIAGECALGVSTDGEYQIIWPDDKACGAFELVANYE